ncbi:hypothetical protein DQR70_06500 [Salmonella enterica subsp. enterica serovar Oslo]|nr:hypothetical protein [Salmonella enterica subsp. enterica serovar Oslo]
MNIKEFMRDVVLNWIKRRDNPHQVTAEQANAYTKEEIEKKVSGKLPVGVLPLYAYGDSTDTPVKYDSTGGTLKFPKGVPVLFYGEPFSAPEGSLTGPDGTKYVTCELSGGHVIYQQYDIKPTTTPTRIYIGEYEIAAGAITRVALFKARGIFSVDAPV